jgi:hypothetical protein
MNRFPIDDATAQRLLSGGLSPDDAPPGYAGLAGMIQAATGPTVPAELTGEAAVVAAGVAAVRSAPPIHRTLPQRNPMLLKLLSAKVAAIAATTVFGVTTAAAAATGHLPAPAQTAVSGALSHVNISVPKPNSHANPHATSHGQTDSSANADFGLCTAFLAAPDSHANSQATTNTTSGKDNSTAFARLIAAHGDNPADTTTYCHEVVSAHTTGKPADTGNPATAGKSDSHTPPSTPNRGGAGSEGSSNAGTNGDSGTSHRP